MRVEVVILLRLRVILVGVGSVVGSGDVTGPPERTFTGLSVFEVPVRLVVFTIDEEMILHRLIVSAESRFRSVEWTISEWMMRGEELGKAELTMVFCLGIATFASLIQDKRLRSDAC